jgi:hypothetical protein
LSSTGLFFSRLSTLTSSYIYEMMRTAALIVCMMAVATHAANQQKALTGGAVTGGTSVVFLVCIMVQSRGCAWLEAMLQANHPSLSLALPATF